MYVRRCNILRLTSRYVTITVVDTLILAYRIVNRIVTAQFSRHNCHQSIYVEFRAFAEAYYVGIRELLELTLC